MSSIADLDLSRPSSLLLLAVIAGNLLLPVVHYWPGDAQAAAPARAEAAIPDAVAPPATVASAVDIVQPVEVPAVAKRVALRLDPPVCRAWGPFSEIAEAEALAMRLMLPGGDFEVFQSRVSASTDYLVTLQVPGRREAANRVVRQLEGHGVESYILDREGAATVLAAGVFSAAPRAEAQRRQLESLGFEAVVEALDRSQDVYHLLARIPAGAEPEVPPLGACGDIAPMEQFL